MIQRKEINFSLHQLWMRLLGGLAGQGMGEGILKESVPEAHTDYVIAVISEEYGSLVSIMILIIFLYISFKSLKLFQSRQSIFKISLGGLATLLIFQTLYMLELILITTNNRDDLTFPKLRWIVSYRKRNFSWISFKLHKEQNLYMTKKRIIIATGGTGGHVFPH